MEADHSGVCKFASAQGDDYEQVSFNIGRLVKSAIRAAEVREERSVADKRVMQDQLLKRLRDSDSISSEPKRARIYDSSGDSDAGYHLDNHENTGGGHSSDEVDSDHELLSRREADNRNDLNIFDEIDSSDDTEDTDDDDTEGTDDDETEGTDDDDTEGVDDDDTEGSDD
jgi:hypothetical protein